MISREAAVVKPLKKRTMALDELQRRTINVLKKCRKRLRTPPYAVESTDEEFIYDVIESLIIDIQQDRQMLKILAKEKS